MPVAIVPLAIDDFDDELENRPSRVGREDAAGVQLDRRCDDERIG